MKNIKIKMYLLLLLGCFCPFSLSASTQDSTKKEFTPTQKKHIIAYRCLNGVNTELNYPKALSIYKELAAQGDAKAMNRLGGMYKLGLGTTQNYDSARYYFQNGVDLGNGKAAYNLAEMYRYAEGGEQDLEKAFEYYTKALAFGNKSSYYTLGYAYFKGFGVTQDYTKAIEMFTKGAEIKNSFCEYFLGLCYVAGYGVSKDTEIGKAHLEKAAGMGNDMAVDFIAKGRLSTYIDKPQNRSATIIDRQKSASFRRVNNTAAENLSGIWEGKIICYDWSGKKIEEEKNISLQLDFNNNQLSGVWIQEDSIAIRVTGHKEDSAWVFDNMQYLQKNIRPWQIKQGRFEIKQGTDSVVMSGNIEQFSTQTMEPTAPTSMVLKRTASIDNTRGGDRTGLRNTLLVYPNPFETQLAVEFNLQQAQQASLILYNEEGQIVYTTTEVYAEGKHQKQLSLNIPSGTYTISLKGKDVNLNSMVIKK